MATNHDHHGLISFLEKNRSHLLRMWGREMYGVEWHSTLKATGPLRVSLVELFDNILNVLSHDSVVFLRENQKYLLLEAPRIEVHFLFLCEKLFIKTLKNHMNLPTKEWLPIRRAINHVFHAIIRKYSSSSCDVCRAIMKEDFSKAIRLEGELRDAFKTNDH